MRIPAKITVVIHHLAVQGVSNLEKSVCRIVPKP